MPDKKPDQPRTHEPVHTPEQAAEFAEHAEWDPAEGGPPPGLPHNQREEGDEPVTDA